MPRRWKIFLSLMSLSIVADQITKWIARDALMGKGRVPVIENFWDWVLAYNTGSAFSMLSGQRALLTIVGVAAVGAVFWIVHTSEDQPTSIIVALGLMAGGAIGNLIDRILEGKVTDFILWRYYEHTWPVFNIADVCLSVAVGLFILSSIMTARQKKRNDKAAAASS